MKVNVTHYYLVNGLPQFYPNQIDISFFPEGCEVEYLGTREKPNNSISLEDWSKPKAVEKNNKRYINDTKLKNGVCCYCEKKLNNRTYTKDHLIPKSKGGKIMMPCCYDCNQEKQDLPLEIYAMLLNHINPFHNKTKIKNALRIRFLLKKLNI